MEEKKTFRILAINPGSTSTKIALIENETVLFSKNVSHDANKLAEFDGISAQMPYRKETILNLLEEKMLLTIWTIFNIISLYIKEMSPNWSLFLFNWL